MRPVRVSGVGRGSAAASYRFSVRAYLRQFAAASGCALEQTGAITRHVQLGETTTQLRFAGPALLPYAAPLAHRFGQVEANQSRHLAIELWDAESTGVSPPPFPCHDDDPLGRGETRRYPEDHARIRFTSGVRPRDGTLAVVTVFDERAEVIRYFASSPDQIPWYEQAAPLRSALQWGLTGTGGLFVHAGAVGASGRCILLAGRSGSGKSTIAVAALLAGFDFLGDDYVYLTLDASGADPVAHSLYATAKLTPESLILMPQLADHPALRLRIGADKHVLDISALGPQGLRHACPVSAIVIPHLQPGRPGGIEPVTPGAALLAMAPSTVLQVPKPTAAELGPLAQLARRIPAFRLAVGRSPNETVPLLRQILERTDS
jgi:hypothetical protein